MRKLPIINPMLRNEFLFRMAYGLLYPAVLGTIFANLLYGLFSGEMKINDTFSTIAFMLMAWYFILDFYIGYDNFKEEENCYEVHFFCCDLVIICSLFAMYYGAWYTVSDYLVYVSSIITCLSLMCYDYFNEKDVCHEENTNYALLNSYNIKLGFLIFLSLVLLVLSIWINDTVVYKVLKYLYLTIMGIVVLYYNFYILSDNSSYDN